jgi:hypothetical protein
MTRARDDDASRQPYNPCSLVGRDGYGRCPARPIPDNCYLYPGEKTPLQTTALRVAEPSLFADPVWQGPIFLPLNESRIGQIIFNSFARQTERKGGRDECKTTNQKAAEG